MSVAIFEKKVSWQKYMNDAAPSVVTPPETTVPPMLVAETSSLPSRDAGAASTYMWPRWTV